MSDERNFDQVARAWLELGPNQAPDRAVSAVLEAVETTPQVRPSSRRFPAGMGSLNRMPLVATIAAALIVVIGAGILLTTRSDDGVGGRTGAPTETETPSATSQSPAFVPDGLRAGWVSGPRSVTGLNAVSGTHINFSDSTLALSQSNRADDPIIVASVTAVGDGEVRLTNSTGCQSSAIGDYRWSLSADGRRLTITALSDGCAVRRAALAGDWNKVACKDPQQPCLGDLAAGTYASLNIAPRLKAGATWTPDYAAVTYTVPDGWANAADWPGELVLALSRDYSTYGPDGAPNGESHEIVVAANPALSEQTADCQGQEVTSVNRSVQGFTDWLRAQSRIVASEPTAITVGGRAGQWIDVKVAPSWTSTCPGVAGGTPAAIILTPVTGTMTKVGGTGTDESWGLVGEEQMRLVFVDIGEGDIALIWVDANDPSRFTDLVAQATPIIESMTFE